MSLSHELRSVVDATFPVVHEASRAVLFAGDLRQTYPRYLVLLHQIIRASVPLMQTAVLRMRQLGDTSSGSGSAEYIEYLEHHIEDESKHDEWLLNDLQTIGYGRQRVLEIEPPRAVAHLVGSQYYWVLHHNPFALLGYIAVLEGAPPSATTLHRLQSESGFAADAFRTLWLHADVDNAHMQELNAFLDRVEISPADRHSILSNAANTVLGVADCVNSLAGFAEQDWSPREHSPPLRARAG